MLIVVVEQRKAVVIEIAYSDHGYTNIGESRFFVCVEEGWRELDISIPEVRAAVCGPEWSRLRGQAIADAIMKATL